MLIDLTKPFEIKFEKFKFNCKKEDINQFAIKKLVRNKYTEQGYSIISGETFEENLLLEFVKKYKTLDRYSKVKLGEFKPQQKVADYNKQILELFSFEEIQKMLFICRICSYIGDPSFPDYIIYKGKEALLRQVYTGDELIPDKLIFFLLAKILGIEIKLSTLDFEDFAYPETLEIDMIKALQDSMETLKKRVNFENPQDTGIDFSALKKWVEKKSIDTDEFLAIYTKFLENIGRDNSLKELFEKLEKMDIDISKKEKQEKIKALREAFGINMIVAGDLLNVYEIVSQK